MIGAGSGEVLVRKPRASDKSSTFLVFDPENQGQVGLLLGTDQGVEMLLIFVGIAKDVLRIM